MCKKIIAITGRKKTGRKTAAWLLANTIEYILQGWDPTEYDAQFRKWVQDVIEDEHTICSTYNCILESFGGTILDHIKLLHPGLQGYDLSDSKIMDKVYIQPTTFEIKDELDEDTPVLDAEYYWRYIQEDGDPSDYWMSLSEFILYYAHYVMKTYFGPDVWLNAHIASIIDSSDYRIYWDAKTQAEVNYIKSHEGLIVEVRNTHRAKSGGYGDINNLESDFVLDTSKGLAGCGTQFWITAQHILNNMRNK